ncbi:MAG TPA: rhomboid family intramembrane serine protease [Opitutaceae bacterium]|nr:rhomboid family intramembrane serine protease [Opitutaceae bacterium]
MSEFSSENTGPVTWIGGRPIYAAHCLAGGFAVTMVLTALLSAFGLTSVLGWLTFSSPEVLAGQGWRILTYGLVNPPSIWFALELLMIVWFGQEVEKFFGRGKFLALYGCLYVLPPVLFTLVGLRFPTSLAGESASFALFVAFATLYPSAEIFFSLLAKWVAWILLGIYLLQLLAGHDWLGVVSLLATAGFAYGFVLWQSGRLGGSPFALMRRAVPAASPRASASWRAPRASPPPDQSALELNAILDKISASGLHSLSDKERAALEAAQQRLRKKSGGR